MNYPHKSRSFSFLVVFFFLSFFCSESIIAQDGEALFKANCTSCHAIKDKVIGPALKGVSQRRPEDWLIKWIKNSQAVIKSGDDYGVKLFNEYNKTVMTSFNLKDDEIKAILAYIKTEESKPEAVPAQGVPGAAPVEQKKSAPWVWLLIAAVVLFLISGVLRRIQETLARAVREKNGLPEPPAQSKYQIRREWVRRNKKLIAVILIVLTIIGNVKAWYAMMAIGVTQGYQPDQPIAYSHKLHAGDMQISCIYCHSGAERGKTAGVPSANVCMNCHKFVKSGPTTGTTEIAKIYKALDYDPDKGTYGPNQKPIQWVRVHNLPDLAYFNHSQHYVVGKIECQTCHGPVQDSMTVAMQYSPLTMQWCINCHRSTKVKMAGNAYYDDLHKRLVNKLGSDSLITVERIGGTECARCHY
jgi:mono/diheme cytochrome c family protein